MKALRLMLSTALVGLLLAATSCSLVEGRGRRPVFNTPTLEPYTTLEVVNNYWAPLDLYLVSGQRSHFLGTVLENQTGSYPIPEDFRREPARILMYLPFSTHVVFISDPLPHHDASDLEFIVMEDPDLSYFNAAPPEGVEAPEADTENR